MPTEEKSLEELKKILREEIERSILIEDAEKKYWLDQLETLPLESVKRLINMIKPRNEKVDGLVELALSQDKNQEHLKKLKQEFAKIKKGYLQLEEGAEHEEEEEKGEKLLKQLDDL